MIRGALFALAVVTGTASAAPALRTLADVPAWDVQLIPNRVVVLDDGFLSASALDPLTGQAAWTQRLQSAPARGMHGLLLDRGNVLAWFADTVYVLDGATGKLARSYKTVVHGGECGLWSIEGACAQVCPCRFQIADCATGALLGKPYDGTRHEEIDPDGGRSSGCWDGGGFLTGRAGNVATLTSVDHGTKEGLRVTAAVDLVTGKEAWRRAEASSPQTYETGHTPDGKTCWFSVRDGALVVVECATGAPLWTTKAPPSPREVPRHLVSSAPRGTLFEQLRTSATLYAERTGKRVWSVKLPAATIAWVKGGGQPLGSGLDKVTAIAILDPATGRKLGTIPVPAGATVTPDPAGGALIHTARELRRYTATGAPSGRVPVVVESLAIGESLIAITTATALVVLDHASLSELGRIEGATGTAYAEGLLGPRRMATFAYDGKTVGRLRLFALEP